MKEIAIECEGFEQAEFEGVEVGVGLDSDGDGGVGDAVWGFVL